MLHLCDDACKHFVIIVVNERRPTMADTLCTGSDRPSVTRSGAPGRSLLVRLTALTALLAGGFGAVAVTAQAAPLAPLAAPAARSCALTYTVRPGDGWTIIAARVDVKPRELYAANGATYRTVITVGQTLCLPASAKAPTTTGATAPAATGTGAGCASNYTVQPGDSWTLIAKKAKVKVSALYAANGATAQTPLYAGRSMCLPAGAAPAPTTTAAPPNTPAPTTTVPQKSYTKAEVEAIIRAVWPDDLEDKALAIAWRESNHKPGVRNWCCFGLFQMHWNAHKKWLATIGVTDSSQLFDPLVNANAALTLYYRAGGWGPWGG
jgi:LysM repeat protein